MNMMNKLTFRASVCVLAAVAILGASPSASATSGTNTLSDITLQGTQFARIALSGAAIGGRPGCHNAAYTVHYGFDISTAQGKALLATAQAALLSGKTISATGGASCTNLGSVTIETLTALTLWAN
jgi:hypothetical protein